MLEFAVDIFAKLNLLMLGSDLCFDKPESEMRISNFDIDGMTKHILDCLQALVTVTSVMNKEDLLMIQFLVKLKIIVVGLLST